MAEIQKQITINVPASEVFKFVSVTPNLVEVWPSLENVTDWHRDEDGLASFGFTYQMAGFRFSGKNRDVEYIRARKIVTVSEGGMQARVTWEFEPVEDGTHVTFTGDYTVSLPLFGKAISGRIAALNAIEVESLLKNMKNKLEK